VIERVRSRLRVGGEAGYSLVEMLVVMVIMSIVFAAITDIFVAGSKASAEQDRRFQAQLSTTNAFASDCNSTLVEPKDDIEAMNNGFATVTPLNPSLTVDSKLKKFKFLTKFPFN